MSDILNSEPDENNQEDELIQDDETDYPDYVTPETTHGYTESGSQEDLSIPHEEKESEEQTADYENNGTIPEGMEETIPENSQDIDSYNSDQEQDGQNYEYVSNEQIQDNFGDDDDADFNITGDEGGSYQDQTPGGHNGADNSPETAKDEQNPPQSLDTNDDPSLVNSQPYSSDKKPVTTVIKSKPGVLNRQLILYFVGGAAILLLILATFVLPELKNLKAAQEEKTKQTPETVSARDYSALVPRDDNTTIGYEPYPDFYDGLTDDEIIQTLPPIDERYQNPENVRQTVPVGSATTSSGGSGYVRPDTRTDRLQAKTISGIKGLTPTQSQYLSGQAQTAYVDQQTDNPYAQFGLPTKEDYLNQALSQSGTQQQQGQASYSTYTSQNDQSSKMAFYNQGRENAGNGYWLAPNSIWQGTIFEAILTSAINTDLPGECTAMVSKNVYSSQDGKYLLIPQNSRLLGTYNSSISYSQKRVQVGWHTLIRPDGYYVNLGNMPATDTRGAAGLPGFINEHPFQYLKAIALLSAMNLINSELGYSMEGTENEFVQNVMANTQSVTNTLGAKMIDRALDVQPTITIKQGTKINIVVSTNLVLPVLEPYPVKYPYQRTR
jgi:type IV secretion system protein VirB10